MKRARKNFEIRFSIPRGRARMGMMITLLLSSAYLVGSETLTLNTFYPSPLGIYKKLTSTDQTILARDGGKVGIGMANPHAMLDVGGAGRFGSQNIVPDSACDAVSDAATAIVNEGIQRYNSTSKQMEFCNGTAWSSMGGGGSVSSSYLGSCFVGPNSFCKCNKGEKIMLLDGNSAGQTGYCSAQNQGQSSVYAACDVYTIGGSLFDCYK